MLMIQPLSCPRSLVTVLAAGMPGYWLGQGLSCCGLDLDTTPFDAMALLAADPVSGEEKNGVGGYLLTFFVSKTVSHVPAWPRKKAALRAVKHVVLQLEREKAHGRERCDDGTCHYPYTGTVLALCFVQSHRHGCIRFPCIYVVMWERTWLPDGTVLPLVWRPRTSSAQARSLDSTQVAAEYGARYQAYCARALREAVLT